MHPKVFCAKNFPVQMRVRLFLRIFTLLLVLCIGTQLPAQGKKRKSELKKAKEYLQFEEYENAIPYVEELLSSDAQNAYYNFWMGKCLYLTYKKNQALPYFQKVETINPDIDEEFHYYYGLTLHYNLDFDKAIDEYRKDLERYHTDSPEYKFINNRISQCLYAKKVSRTPDSKLVKINNMGEQINSEFAEHSPVISADNQVLVYTARRPDSRGADEKAHFYDEDIYVSHNENGTWTKGENIGLPINSKGHDATISMTADGKTLYIYRHKKDGGLYKTDFDEEAKKWKEPKAIQKPLNSSYYEASICQSADSNILFFTSNRPGGMGGLDIYMSKKIGKNDWSEPKNLGAPINSAFDEDAPYFHPDGRTFYFSSNRGNSIGGYDVFVSEFDSTSENFLEPLNMGPPINTPDDEIYFVLSGDGLHGYYASGKEGGSGEKDIYEVIFPYSRYPKRYYALEVVGIVQDANTLDTIPSVIRLVDQELGVAIDSMVLGAEVGQYSFALEPTRTYSIEVNASGYNPVNEEFTTPAFDGEDIYLERNLFVSRELAPVVEESKPLIENIYFDFDKSDLRSSAKEELDMVADILLKNPDMKVEIAGHTDWYGNYEYNNRLSERRSKAAYKYLREIGVPSNRIQETWLSENIPIESNLDDRGRQYNRRCELTILNKENQPVLASVKIKPGSEGPEIDHTKPKGQPGLDNPNAGPGGSADSPKTIASANFASSSTEETPYTSESVAAITSETLKNLDIHNIYFDFDKASVRNDGQAELEKIAALLSKNEHYTLVIKGHTDNFGSVEYNQSLSENRCANAFEALSALGVPVAKMSFSGFSELIPIADNANDRGRQNNRRVEFEIKLGNKVVYRSLP